MYDENQLKLRKKLIEVAIPLDAINAASIHEKITPRKGHPSTFHLWWARRPLAAARAVIFCQMVDDPSELKDEFPTKIDQEKERERLFRLISELVKWENLNNEDILLRAKKEIQKSWERFCDDNSNHPQSEKLFRKSQIPNFHDPFAGGGTIPLEAQRLGFNSSASDLNPVAVLLNKALIEIPPKFSGFSPINPEYKKQKSLINKTWTGSEGLSEDIKYYGSWLKNFNEQQLKEYYPKVKITEEIVRERKDLEPYFGKELTVMAWIWARTVKSPNPSFSHIEIPLASTFLLSTKKGKEAYIEPIINEDGYEFLVKVGTPSDLGSLKMGTKIGRGANFRCIMSGEAIESSYIYSEGKKGRMSQRLMALVLEGNRERIYLSPSPEQEKIGTNANPQWIPDTPIEKNPRYLSPPLYGMENYSDIYTNRQLLVLSNFCKSLDDLKIKILEDFENIEKVGNEVNSQFQNDYTNALLTYMSFIIGRQANRGSTISCWDNGLQKIGQAFGRQAIPMTWDFCESNPFCNSSGNWLGQIEFPSKVIEALPPNSLKGMAIQALAQEQTLTKNKIISTDPPYYDNIGYADLSDFFYVWLRRCLKDIYPKLLGTISTPKADELVASSYRHGSKKDAEIFFLDGMSKTMRNLAQHMHPSAPLTIYYAFRQKETKDQASTGWEAFLEAIINSNLLISGTWPIRTELTGNLKKNISALASSIILVCRKREDNCQIISRKEFRQKLKSSLPKAIYELEQINIAPVDLAQAAIGPGIEIFSKAKSVLNADDSKMSVREALKDINIALDEYLSKSEAELDPDTLFALTFFESFGYTERPFGDAEGLAKARNVSVEGIVRAGILKSVGGKVNLIKRENLSQDWDPLKDDRLCVWEATQYLIRTLEIEGEIAASNLLKTLKNISGFGDLATSCRSLAYRLYNHSEKRKQAEEARSYNSLIISWPELEKISAHKINESKIQTNLF